VRRVRMEKRARRRTEARACAGLTRRPPGRSHPPSSSSSSSSKKRKARRLLGVADTEREGEGEARLRRPRSSASDSRRTNRLVRRRLLRRGLPAALPGVEAPAGGSGAAAACATVAVLPELLRRRVVVIGFAFGLCACAFEVMIIWGKRKAEADDDEVNDAMMHRRGRLQQDSD